ncbi:hypothetical protein ACFX2C_006660 [Malus domestica]
MFILTLIRGCNFRGIIWNCSVGACQILQVWHFRFTWRHRQSLSLTHQSHYHPRQLFEGLRATPPLLVAQGTGKGKGPEGRWIGLQRWAARGPDLWRIASPTARGGCDVRLTPGLASVLFLFFVSSACLSLASGGASADSFTGQGARAPVSAGDCWEATWLPTVRSISMAL